MSFGRVWRSSDPSFWDEMWSRHKDSEMTKRMLQMASEADPLFEIGCGHGHFVQSLIDGGWRGRFVGFEMSVDGANRTRRRCEAAGIDHEVFSGNFVQWSADKLKAWRAGAPRPSSAIAMCRGVVQHQAHWMPMTLAMLRLAPLAIVGVGYVSETEYHDGPLRPKGHYDVKVSPSLLVQEAEAVGVAVHTKVFSNRARRCKELLAVFADAEH